MEGLSTEKSDKIEEKKKGGKKRKEEEKERKEVDVIWAVLVEEFEERGEEQRVVRLYLHTPISVLQSLPRYTHLSTAIPITIHLS